jgi:hypothetical protein
MSVKVIWKFVPGISPSKKNCGPILLKSAETAECSRAKIGKTIA